MQLANLIDDVFDDDLFRSFFGRDNFILRPPITKLSPISAFAPSIKDGVRVTENEDDTITYSFDVPGVTENDITASLNTENRELSVIAKNDSRDIRYYVKVGSTTDIEGSVKKLLKDGVLTLTFKNNNPKNKSNVRVLFGKEKSLPDSKSSKDSK